MLLQRKHAGNGIKEPKQLKRSEIFRAEFRVWCWSPSPTQQKSCLCEAVRSSPADVSISWGLSGRSCSEGCSPSPGSTAHFRQAKIPSEMCYLTWSSASTAEQRWALRHIHIRICNKFQAVFRPRKIVEFSEIVVVNETNRHTVLMFLPVSTSSWAFPQADGLPGWELHFLLAHRWGQSSEAWAGQSLTGWGCGQLFPYSFPCSDTADLPALSRYNVITSQRCFNEILGFCTMTQPNSLEQEVNLRIWAVVTSLLPRESPPLCLLQSLGFWGGSSRAVPPLFLLGFIKSHLHPVGDFPDPRLTQERWDQD